jgi:hypothetical protein
MLPNECDPGRASFNAASSLKDYARKTKRGIVIPDNIGFVVNLPNRKSFSPDVAFHIGKPACRQTGLQGFVVPSACRRQGRRQQRYPKRHDSYCGTEFRRDFSDDPPMNAAFCQHWAGG